MCLWCTNYQRCVVKKSISHSWKKGEEAVFETNLLGNENKSMSCIYNWIFPFVNFVNKKMCITKWSISFQDGWKYQHLGVIQKEKSLKIKAAGLLFCKWRRASHGKQNIFSCYIYFDLFGKTQQYTVHTV